jgi:hypothetical protein
VITGNVVIEAASLEAATELAMRCPVFDVDGSVEVWPLPTEVAASAAVAAAETPARNGDARWRETA